MYKLRKGMINMLSKENVKRQFSNAVEWLYSRGRMHFPKNLGTDKEFRVKTFDGSMITFDVFDGELNLGGFVIFVTPELSYNRVKEGNEDFAIKYFIKKIVEDLYNYHNLQLGGRR